MDKVIQYSLVLHNMALIFKPLVQEDKRGRYLHVYFISSHERMRQDINSRLYITVNKTA